MSMPAHHSGCPDDFSGLVRLFPVPNLVLFPHVMQPLHVFELRYRELVEDALADDRLIATAQFQPGWEADYEGRPPLKPFGCLGRIVTHHRMDDGRFNLLLVGLCRIELFEELPPDRSFRQARAAPLEDVHGSGSAADHDGLQRELLQIFHEMLSDMPDIREQLESLLMEDISLGTLADIMAYSLDLPLEIKEALLAEQDVGRRARQLLVAAAKKLSLEQADDWMGGERFPPDFSDN